MRRISENIGGNFWEILEIVEPVEKFELGKHNGALFGNFGILCYKGGLFGNFGNLQRVLGTSATDHCLVPDSRTELVQA